jgi:hypothetical protein
MVTARLRMRLCALRKPRHVVNLGLRKLMLRASSHVLRFNRIFGVGEGQGSVNTSAFFGTHGGSLPNRPSFALIGGNRQRNMHLPTKDPSTVYDSSITCPLAVSRPPCLCVQPIGVLYASGITCFWSRAFVRLQTLRDSFGCRATIAPTLRASRTSYRSTPSGLRGSEWDSQPGPYRQDKDR